MADLTPHECVKQAIWNTVNDVEYKNAEVAKNQIADAVLQFLDPEGYMLPKSIISTSFERTGHVVIFRL